MQHAAPHSPTRSTAATGAQADQIARHLVTARLAACVQMQPITSIYRWDGRIETAGEVVLLIKTRAGLFEAVASAIKQLHTYDTPEILMTPLSAIDPTYRAWLFSETADS